MSVTEGVGSADALAPLSQAAHRLAARGVSADTLVRALMPTQDATLDDLHDAERVLGTLLLNVQHAHGCVRRALALRR